MTRAVLFSALEGQLIKGGKPLQGATLLREWAFAENSLAASDSVVSDENGRFHFDAVIHEYRKPRFFAQQTVVSQLVRVQTNGSEWRVWVGTKLDLLAGTEPEGAPSSGTSSEVPLRVIIDLDSQKVVRRGILGHTLFEPTP